MKSTKRGSKALRKLRAVAEDVMHSIHVSAKLFVEARSEGGMVVYLLHCPSTGLTKIGKTTDLAERITTIQRMSGAELFLEGAFSDPGGMEAFLHRRFAARRQHGEWFRLSQSDMYQLALAVSAFKGLLTDPPDDYQPMESAPWEN